MINHLQGKRNIMSGIAKTINKHFKKHSLAIVSIKGRAEGTSIREVVHHLEVCKWETFPLLD